MIARRQILAALAFITALGGPVWGDPVRLDYPRQSNGRRDERVGRIRSSLPRQLTIDRQVTARGAGVAVGRTSREVELHRYAWSAAVWMADTLVETAGRREFFRVGFHDGMRQGLIDPTLGDRDYTEGEHAGWHQTEARALGTETGEWAAIELARDRAEDQVVEQFARLDVEPVYLPRSGDPSYLPVLPEVTEPILADLFAEHPLAGISFADRALSFYVDDWSYDASRLYDCDDWREFYDTDWHDAATAFEGWAQHPDRASYYLTLPTDTDRQRFEDSFAQAFDERLAALFHAELLPAFEQGVGEGWNYGAFLNQELRYREGFVAGYLAAVEDSARLGFHERYIEQYEADYRRSFDDWSYNPKPELGEVVLVDGNRDGVFEPGEEVRVEYELINLGGGAGRFAVQLEGRRLERPGIERIELPARSIVGTAPPLRARISPDTPGRSQTELQLILADRLIDLPLRVSYPLQLRRGAWHVRRSNLDGELVLEIDVENESERALDGAVELTTSALPGTAQTRSLGTVEPGHVRRVTLPVTGLDPVDLIAGRVSLQVDLRGHGAPHDRFVYHIPDAARDLGNRDLLLFIVRQAHEETAAERVAALRQLLVTRLREDWKVAVMRNGNPYKFDFRNGATTTALGDLVRTYQSQLPDTRQHQIFAGLSQEVLILSNRLPGIHPFLRRYVRKLARELP